MNTPDIEGDCGFSFNDLVNSKEFKEGNKRKKILIIKSDVELKDIFKITENRVEFLLEYLSIAT